MVLSGDDVQEEGRAAVRHLTGTQAMHGFRYLDIALEKHGTPVQSWPVLYNPPVFPLKQKIFLKMPPELKNPNGFRR